MLNPTLMLETVAQDIGLLIDELPTSSNAIAILTEAENLLVEKKLLASAKKLQEAETFLPFGMIERLNNIQNLLVATGFKAALRYRQLTPGTFVLETPPIDGVQVRFKRLSKMEDGTVDAQFEFIAGQDKAESFYGFTEIAIQDIVEKVIAFNEKKRAEAEADEVVSATPKIIMS